MAVRHRTRPAQGRPLAFLEGGGELGALIREKDWGETPLGPPDLWPQSLKTTLGILLNSRYPMFVFWGPQLVKIYNDGYRPITGHKHPWALGKPAEEVWPEIWSDIKPLVDRALAGDPTWSDDLMLCMERNGFPEEVYFTFSYSPVPDESGGTGGMFCACTETTGTVLGERRLRTLRDLAAAPADSRRVADACTLSMDVLDANRADIPFALVYLTDPDGTATLAAQAGVAAGDPAAPRVILDCDPGGDTTSPWPVGEVVSRRTAHLVSHLADRFRSVPPGPWPEPPTAAVLLPLVDRGQERGIGALVLGISSRRPFDAEYQRWVELVAAQLSASIANARAAEDDRKRVEALAELDRAKTAFFSNVSHEFRTPLTLMLGPLQELLDAGDRLHPDDRERVEVARRNTLRLLKLVNSLLDFSRIEAGRMQGVFEPTDLAAYTTGLAGVFRAAIEAAGLRFVVSCDLGGEEAYVDRDMWEKIVFNLLSNALKFTIEGEIGVRMGRDGGNLELEVSDTGTGIPAAELPRLFDRFYRVQNANGRSFEGTGIGLALVQELVKMHGGSVAVESEEGRGTTFRVRMPLGAAHLPADRVSDRRSAASPARGTGFVEEAARWLPSAGHAASTSRAGVRIVAADDNADMRDYLRRILSPFAEVEIVSNGTDALEAIRREKPDVVLSDVMMPGIDGKELLHALRSDPATASIPVVLLSARAGEEARVEGLESGADDYLVKPFTANELMAKLSSLVQLSRLRREGETRLADANRELRRHALEQQALLDVLPIGIGIAGDRECRHIRINRAMAEMLNVPPEANASLTADAADRPSTFRVMSPGGAEVPDADLPMQVAAREGRDVKGLELDIVDETGRVRRLLEYAAPLFDDHGEPRGAVGAFVDITDRVEAERALERASRLKDEFLATLSHELRTPLNAVLGWSRMLREGSMDPAMRERAFESLERNAKAQAQLVDDLLDISRIMAGKLHIKTEPVDVAAVVANAADTVRSGAIAKGVHLSTRFDSAAELVVIGDADRLQQVVWNLASNAIKFTPADGRVEISVSGAGSYAEIAVSDTGQGIAPSFQPHLFKRFRQMDASAARRHGGLGLGLSIVRHLTEAHGGVVSAESPGEGQGATFRVRLPLRRASAATAR